MTVLSAVPDRQRTTSDRPCEAEVAALMAVFEQVQQVRADQRAALEWLAEHPDSGRRA